MNNTDHGSGRFDWPACIWLVPVACYFFNIGHYATNTPYLQDDIFYIIRSTIGILSAPDFRHSLGYYFTQSAEYQTFFIALAGRLSAGLLGYIDLRFITLAGNCALFAAVLIAVAKLARNRDEFTVMALPAFLLLSSPVYGDCAVWANCAVGHFGSVFMGSLVSLFLIRQGLGYFLLFETGMIAAVLMQGNGMAFIPVGFFGIAFFQHESRQKYFLVIHALVSALILLLTWRYFDPEWSARLLPLAHHSAQLPWKMIAMIAVWIVGWFGTWAAWHNNLAIACLVGSAEILLVAWLMWHHGKTLLYRYPHVILLSAYLMLTIIAAATARSVYSGGDTGLLFTDRYQTYSLVLAICLLLLLLCLVRDRQPPVATASVSWRLIAGAAALLAAGYCISVNANKRNFFIAFRNQQLHCASEWAATGEAKSCLWHGDDKVILDEAINMKILYIDASGGSPLRCDGNPVYARYCWK